MVATRRSKSNEPKYKTGTSIKELLKLFGKTVLGSSIGFLVSDRLGLKFTQVGSVVAGNKIVVTIYYQKEAISGPKKNQPEKPAMISRICETRVLIFIGLVMIPFIPDFKYVS